MKIQHQVSNLKLSKKLRDLGVPQESIFFWIDYQDNRGSRLAIDEWREAKKHPTYSAYTTSELGVLLPEKVVIDNNNYIIEQPIKYKNKRVVQLVCYLYVGEKMAENKAQECKLIFGKSIEADNEPNARAKMLIYCIKNNLINIEDIKI